MRLKLSKISCRVKRLGKAQAVNGWASQAAEHVGERVVKGVAAHSLPLVFSFVWSRLYSEMASLHYPPDHDLLMAMRI